MANSKRRLGVVLFQLGGPDTLEAIEPFLFNLFCDPDIIDFPFARIGRKPLAKLISSTRAKRVQHHYSVIGGGSPIRKFTEQQATALENRLREDGFDAHCFVAMRYWHPFTAEAIAQLSAAACDEIVLLPLYPHYSSTTTGSSLNEWNRLFRADVPVHFVGDPAADAVVVTEHDRLAVTAEALHLPEHLEVLIAGFPIGSHVTAGDVKLPTGVTLATSTHHILAVIAAGPGEVHP